MDLLERFKALEPNKEEWVLATDAIEQLKSIMCGNYIRKVISENKVVTQRYKSRVYINIKTLEDCISNRK